MATCGQLVQSPLPAGLPWPLSSFTCFPFPPWNIAWLLSCLLPSPPTSAAVPCWHAWPASLPMASLSSKRWCSPDLHVWSLLFSNYRPSGWGECDSSSIWASTSTSIPLTAHKGRLLLQAVLLPPVPHFSDINMWMSYNHFKYQSRTHYSYSIWFWILLWVSHQGMIYLKKYGQCSLGILSDFKSVLRNKHITAPVNASVVSPRGENKSQSAMCVLETRSYLCSRGEVCSVNLSILTPTLLGDLYSWFCQVRRRTDDREEGGKGDPCRTGLASAGNEVGCPATVPSPQLLLGISLWCSIPPSLLLGLFLAFILNRFYLYEIGREGMYMSCS